MITRYEDRQIERKDNFKGGEGYLVNRVILPADGKWADLAVINLSRPSMRPVLAPAQNLVYSGSKDCVRLTMVAGRILYENGEFHVGDSVEHIIAEAEKYTKELI